VPLTKLQELEWHFHAAIFSLWMGFGYTINAHPRVDSFTESLTLRRKAWIELAGCLLLALPYMTPYYSIDFVAAAYTVHEQSASVRLDADRGVERAPDHKDVERGDLAILSGERPGVPDLLGATGFSYVFRVLGGDDLMTSTLVNLGVDTGWEMLAFVMILIFLLGFPFEWIEICLIVLPIFGPILLKYDFSEHLGDQRYMMAWFGTLVAVNLQTAFMTPPFGATLFYMKGTAPPGVTMSDVYRAMYPFVAL
jgi:Tripartite ATP-independent periplasmic transporter, DctM component